MNIDKIKLVADLSENVVLKVLTPKSMRQPFTC